MSTQAKKFVKWGIIVISLALVALSPLEAVFEDIKDVLPWAIVGIAISEVFWNLGAAIMAFAVGIRIRWKDVLRLRQLMAELTVYALNSRLFWIGFWINFAAALSDDVIAIIAVINGLPIQSWGILLIVFADTVATFALRHIILHRWRLRRTNNNPSGE